MPTIPPIAPTPGSERRRHGAMTVRMAQALLAELDSQEFEVLYDHGEKGNDPPNSLGRLFSSFDRYGRYTALGGLDIALVRRSTNQVIILVEIEESNYRPKVLLGQIFGTLLGSRISFQGKRHWTVGPWTTLIVLAKNSNRAGHERMVFIEEQANKIKTHLDTPNASIGRIVLGEFADENELQQKLRDYIAVGMENAEGDAP